MILIQFCFLFFCFFLEDIIKGIRGWKSNLGQLSLHIMDFSIILEAEEGPLSLSGGRDFPSILFFHQYNKEIKEDLKLEFNVIYIG